MGINHYLRHYRNHRFLQAQPLQFVLQGLGYLVANGTLGVGHTIFQGNLVQHITRKLGPQQYETDLRAVAVGNHDAMTFCSQGRNMVAGFTCRPVLVEHGKVLVILDQRVTPHRNDHQWRLTCFAACSISCVIVCFWGFHLISPALHRQRHQGLGRVHSVFRLRVDA